MTEGKGLGKEHWTLAVIALLMTGYGGQQGSWITQLVESHLPLFLLEIQSPCLFI